MKKLILLWMAVMVTMLGYAQLPLSSSRTLTKLTGKKVTSLQDKKSRTAKTFASKRAASDYVIIKDQPEGEAKTYKRSGEDYYASGNYAYKGVQSGKITIVFNGNDVYFLEPIANYACESWVKGTLSDDGKTITVPLFQNLLYSSSYDACVMTAFSTTDKNGDFVPDKTITEVTYTVSENTITLNGSDENHFLGAFWTDDDSWSGFGEWDTVLTEYVQDFTLITPPEGLTFTDMPLSGLDYDGNDVTGTVKVGIDGSDIYFQGLVPDLPDAWLKGTVSGNEVEIPVTYVGEIEGEAIYAGGYDGDLSSIYLLYDSEANTYEVDGYILLSYDEDTMDLYIYYNGFFLGTRPAMLEVPEDLETEAMPFSGIDGSDETVKGTVEVGFDGNDVYFQGLIAEVPTGWIKGTFNEDKTQVTFPIQYVGQDEDSAGSVYLVGSEDGETVSPVVFSYDATTNMFTSETFIIANWRKDIIYYYSVYQPELVIGTPCNASWVAAEQGYENQQDITEIVIDPDVTIGRLATGEGTNSPKYYVSGTSVRMYAGNTLTITSTKLIKKIDFYMTGSAKQMLLEADRGKYSFEANKGTWTGEENEIVFSVPTESGSQARIQRIDVTYMDYATTLVTPPADLAVESYLFLGTDTYYEEQDTHEVLVGFDGDEVYMQGLSTFVEDGWVKGTLKDGKLTIPGWYLGEMATLNGYYDLVFGGAEMDYDAETNTFTCAEYQSYVTVEGEEYAMDEYADITITKVIEKAATPAQPTITYFGKNTYDYYVLYLDVPIKDVNGDPMVPTLLSYQIFTDIQGTVAELVFDPSEYEKLTEEMSIIPYNFEDSWDIYKGGSVIYINQTNVDDWNKIGVKSIYTGGGETNESEIFWYTIKDPEPYVDGINTVSTIQTADAPVYNLQGVRVKNPSQKGIYIRDGRKMVIK